MTDKKPKLSLGPSLYFWPKEQVFHYYRKIADSAIEVVYLGETVCSKRRELNLTEWIEIGRMLEAKGKEVVLSTMAMLSAESELKMLRKICQQSPWLIEANDMAAVQLLEDARLPFVAGPSINIYNGRTLAVLQKSGCKRWVMPVELSAVAFQSIRQECREFSGTVPESEVFSYGCLPLAYSARCFTSRHHKLPKDDCQFKCREYPAGLKVYSQEQACVFTINGIQAQSGSRYDLCDRMEEMEQTGVSHIRLSPELEGMNAVIERFQQALLGRPVTAVPAESCNGYWLGQPGMDLISASEVD